MQIEITLIMDVDIRYLSTELQEELLEHQTPDYEDNILPSHYREPLFGVKTLEDLADEANEDLHLEISTILKKMEVNDCSYLRLLRV